MHCNVLFVAILIVIQHIGSLMPVNGIKIFNKYFVVCAMQNINGTQQGLQISPVNNCNTRCWEYIRMFRILSSSYKLFSLFPFRLWAFRRTGSVDRNTHFLCHFFVFCFYLLVHTGFELKKAKVKHRLSGLANSDGSKVYINEKTR